MPLTLIVWAVVSGRAAGAAVWGTAGSWSTGAFGACSAGPEIVHCFGGDTGITVSAKTASTVTSYRFSSPSAPLAMIPVQNPVPFRRKWSAVVYQDSVVLYGGEDFNENAQPETFLFNIPTAAFSPATPGTARHSHTAVLVNGTMYVVGGCNSVSVLLDFAAYDIAGDMWSPVNVTGLYSPPARYGHAAVLWEDKMVIVGGCFSMQYCGTGIHIDFFDFATNSWAAAGSSYTSSLSTVVVSAPTSPPSLSEGQPKPYFRTATAALPAVAYCAAVVSVGRIFLVGGAMDGGSAFTTAVAPLAGLWGGWRLLPASLNQGIGLLGHSLVLRQGTLWVFGGTTVGTTPILSLNTAVRTASVSDIVATAGTSSVTPTYTTRVTKTHTPTSSPTPTSTHTARLSGTPSPTVTPSETDALSVTNTPSQPPTRSPTSSSSATGALTGTPSASPTLPASFFVVIQRQRPFAVELRLYHVSNLGPVSVTRECGVAGPICTGVSTDDQILCVLTLAAGTWRVCAKGQLLPSLSGYTSFEVLAEPVVYYFTAAADGPRVFLLSPIPSSMPNFDVVTSFAISCHPVLWRGALRDGNVSSVSAFGLTYMSSAVSGTARPVVCLCRGVTCAPLPGRTADQLGKNTSITLSTSPITPNMALVILGVVPGECFSCQCCAAVLASGDICEPHSGVWRIPTNGSMNIQNSEFSFNVSIIASQIDLLEVCLSFDYGETYGLIGLKGQARRKNTSITTTQTYTPSNSFSLTATLSAVDHRRHLPVWCDVQRRVFLTVLAIVLAAAVSVLFLPILEFLAARDWGEYEPHLIRDIRNGVSRLQYATYASILLFTSLPLSAVFRDPVFTICPPTYLRWALLDFTTPSSDLQRTVIYTSAFLLVSLVFLVAWRVCAQNLGRHVQWSILRSRLPPSFYLACSLFGVGAVETGAGQAGGVGEGPQFGRWIAVATAAALVFLHLIGIVAFIRACVRGRGGRAGPMRAAFAIIVGAPRINGLAGSVAASFLAVARTGFMSSARPFVSHLFFSVAEFGLTISVVAALVASLRPYAKAARKSQSRGPPRYNTSRVLDMADGEDVEGMGSVMATNISSNSGRSAEPSRNSTARPSHSRSPLARGSFPCFDLYAGLALVAFGACGVAVAFTLANPTASAVPLAALAAVSAAALPPLGVLVGVFHVTVVAWRAHGSASGEPSSEWFAEVSIISKSFHGDDGSPHDNHNIEDSDAQEEGSEKSICYVDGANDVSNSSIATCEVEISSEDIGLPADLPR